MTSDPHDTQVPSHPMRKPKKRLKPGIQNLFYHARQPILILSAGCLLALAINFSLAQVHLSEAPNTASETSVTLDGFDLQTNPETQEVRLTLKRNESQGQPLQVQENKKGSQYTLTLQNTQLSQGMVDSGLPVVIDNHNKLIARAVPGKTLNQSRIIIPNMPSQSDYRVLVYEQRPGQKPRLLNGANNAPSDVQVAQRPTISKAPLQTLASNETPVLRMNKAASNPVSHNDLNTLITRNTRPQPRPAVNVEETESRFESVLNKPNHTTLAMDVPPLRDSQPIALASVASERNNQSNGSKRRIQIVENRAAAQTDTTVMPTSKPITQGPVTYIPTLTAKSGSRKAGHFPFWNPYVVKDDTEKEPAAQEPGTANSGTFHLQQLPPLQQPTQTYPAPVTASQDPLQYLHQLPNNNGQVVSSLPLQPLPDLTKGLPPLPEGASGNPSLSPAPGSVPSSGVNSIQFDSQLLHSIKYGLTHLPIWLYIVFGLFFGGIGLFATLGSLVLIQQIWLNLRPVRPMVQPQVAPKLEEAIEDVRETTPIAEEKAPDLEAIQFRDTANINAMHYLNHQSQALDQQQAVRQAVKKSVLLHFPSHRVGSKPKTGQPNRKTNHLLF